MTLKEQEALRLLVEVYREVSVAHNLMIKVSINAFENGNEVPRSLADTMERLDRAKGSSSVLIFMILKVKKSLTDSVYDILDAQNRIDEAVQKLILLSME